MPVTSRTKSQLDETVAAIEAAARQYASGFLDRIEEANENEDPQVGLQRCADLCVQLASGRCDARCGRFLTPEDDLQALGRVAAGTPA